MATRPFLRRRGGNTAFELRRTVALALTLVLLSGNARAQKITNPDLFRKSLEAAAQACKQYGTSNDEKELERVTRIGYRLAKASGFEKYPFTFAIVDIPIPNAFALPAGQIFVTRGLLDLGLSDDMLAGLLGHEIAHVTQEHFLKMRRRANLFNALSQLLTIGLIAANNSSRGDVYQGPGGIWQRDPSNTADLLQGAQATSVVISELLLRSYSRDNEDESDEVGQRLAAAAGFDPDGSRQLMAKMRARIPQSKTFGYWQTHPFFDDRVRAAEARAAALTPLDGPTDEELAEYRRTTQELLLGQLDQPKVTQEAKDTLERFALLAWPAGSAAETLRLKRLHELRTAMEERLALSRDYGRVIEEYLREARTIRELTPDSPTLAVLTREIGDMRAELERLYPQAVQVLEAGVYETSFLESFLSNYPDSPKAADAALALGLAYSRLGRETEAVERLLFVWEQTPDSPAGQAAARGLRNLAGALTRLGALEALAHQDREREIAELAARRLEEFAGRYEQLDNGAEYLARYPNGEYAQIVEARLDELAENAYREMVLYQQIGDVAKAVERANQILEHAPLSPAADRLGRELEDQGISG